MDRREILSFEEIERFVRAAVPLGITKLRITGGEPLVRRDICHFLRELVRLQAILLNQDRNFSEIFIKKHTEFESVINEISTRAQDDWR